MSQKELGDALGVSEDSIGTYENRGTKPKQYVIDKLQYIFGINTAHLKTSKLTIESYNHLFDKTLTKEHNEASTQRKQSLVEDGEVEYKPASLLYADLIKQQNKLIASLNKQSETCNTILQRLSENVEKKVEAIDANLNDALGRVDSLKYDLYSGRKVVLQSLARLEKKPVNHLLNEADSIIASLMQEQSNKQNTLPGKGK